MKLRLQDELIIPISIYTEKKMRSQKGRRQTWRGGGKQIMEPNKEEDQNVDPERRKQVFYLLSLRMIVCELWLVQHAIIKSKWTRTMHNKYNYLVKKKTVILVQPCCIKRPIQLYASPIYKKILSYQNQKGRSPKHQQDQIKKDTNLLLLTAERRAKDINGRMVWTRIGHRTCNRIYN